MQNKSKRMTTPFYIQNIHNKEFPTVLFRRGYDCNEVNDFLDEVVDYCENLYREKMSLEQKNAELEQELNKLRGRKEETLAVSSQSDLAEQNINQSIRVAREFVDKLCSNARQEAKLIVENAKTCADRMVNDAMKECDEWDQRKVNLRQMVISYKSQLVGCIKAHLELIDKPDLDIMSEKINESPDKLHIPSTSANTLPALAEETVEDEAAASSFPQHDTSGYDDDLSVSSSSSEPSLMYTPSSSEADDRQKDLNLPPMGGYDLPDDLPRYTSPDMNSLDSNDIYGGSHSNRSNYDKLSRSDDYQPAYSNDNIEPSMNEDDGLKGENVAADYGVPRRDSQARRRRLRRRNQSMPSNELSNEEEYNLEDSRVYSAPPAPPKAGSYDDVLENEKLNNSNTPDNSKSQQREVRARKLKKRAIF